MFWLIICVPLFIFGVLCLKSAAEDERKLDNQRKERYVGSEDYERMKKQRAESLEKWKLQYPELLEQYNVPKEASVVHINIGKYYYFWGGFKREDLESKKGDLSFFVDTKDNKSSVQGQSSFFPLDKWLLWKTDDTLNFFPDISVNPDEFVRNSIPFKIKIESIDYFEREGDVHYVTSSVTYGGSKPNIKGAVIGGALAGTAGAIIGSQTKSNLPVNCTSTKELDKRMVIMYFKNQPPLYFPPDDYRSFEIIVPEKERNIVMAQREQLAIQAMVKDSIPITEQLENLGKLKDSGILTEDEFEDKKKELLARL